MAARTTWLIARVDVFRCFRLLMKHVVDCSQAPPSLPPFLPAPTPPPPLTKKNRGTERVVSTGLHTLTSFHREIDQCGRGQCSSASHQAQQGQIKVRHTRDACRQRSFVWFEKRVSVHKKRNVCVETKTSYCLQASRAPAHPQSLDRTSSHGSHDVISSVFESSSRVFARPQPHQPQ